MDQAIALITIAGATAWWTTTLVNKAGPFGILARFRAFIHRLTNANSPLTCMHCTSFWVGLFLASFYYGGPDAFKALVTLFGIMGIAQALRGLSGEF